MDRMGRLFAALRVVLVAMAVCLLGSPTLVGPAASEVHDRFDAAAAHTWSIDAPAPEPTVAELRDEDPRGGEEDDDLAHGPRAALTPPSLMARLLRTIRGPPSAPRGVSWRPRSSRGPPAQV